MKTSKISIKPLDTTKVLQLTSSSLNKINNKDTSRSADQVRQAELENEDALSEEKRIGISIAEYNDITPEQ